MSGNTSTSILKTPRVLSGYDVKGEDVVISRANGEKELWLVSHGRARKVCRGFLPRFLGDDLLYLDAENGDRTDIFLYRGGTTLSLTHAGRNLAPQPSPDGNTVAFLSDRDGFLSLYVTDLEGESTRVLTPTPPIHETLCLVSLGRVHPVLDTRNAHVHRRDLVPQPEGAKDRTNHPLPRIIHKGGKSLPVVPLALGSSLTHVISVGRRGALRLPL